MADDPRPEDEPLASVCPWCSATFEGEPENCPSCGATLTGDVGADPALPGLTAIDAAAIVRAKEPVKRPRNRLLSWISGEYPEDLPAAAQAGALAPPDADVRREMLRLELEATVANLQAEADAILAEAAAEGRPIDATAPPAAADPQAVTDEADEPADAELPVDPAETDEPADAVDVAAGTTEVPPDEAPIAEAARD